MTQFTFLSFITFILLLACGSADTTIAQTNSKQGSVENSCLAQYAMDPNSLMSVQELAAITEVDESSIELKQLSEHFKKSKYYTKSEMRFSTYVLPSDRKMKITVGSNTMEVPADNQIMIGGMILLEEQKRKIEIPFSEWFDNRYRVMTDVEQESFETQMDEEMEKVSKDTPGSESTNELATDFVKKLADAFIYESVQGIGDQATMESMGKFSEVSLHVLHKNIVFSVKVDVSNDKEVNKDLAKKIALAISNKCE